MQAIRNMLLAAALAATMAGPAAAQAPSAMPEMTEGEVRKVDSESRKLTLKHGPIKNLDMPPMTMVFNVNDPALLQRLQVGDKVRFSVVQESGRYVVTAIEPAK